MSQPLNPSDLAAALPAPKGLQASQYASNIATHWPAVVRALAAHGITSTNALIAAAATIRVECPAFAPIRECGGSDYFSRHYDGRADLGNTHPGDGARFCGRGFAQLTGRANYHRLGAQLGVDLVGNPDLALEADTAAAIFASFFATHHVAEAADAEEWPRVRRIWNGGTNGMDDFLRHVAALKRATHDESLA